MFKEKRINKTVHFTEVLTYKKKKSTWAVSMLFSIFPMSKAQIHMFQLNTPLHNP